MPQNLLIRKNLKDWIISFKKKYDDGIIVVRLERQEGIYPVEFKIPSVLYHITPSKNVPSILRYGLEPRLSTRAEFHRYNPRIYFTISKKYAENLIDVFNRHDSINIEYSILAVDREAVNPIYKDKEFDAGIYTTKPVRPSAIKLVK